jgi:exopolysaccharide biosynthesis polyprenyl glycosylphosphotransferase
MSTLARTAAPTTLVAAEPAAGAGVPALLRTGREKAATVAGRAAVVLIPVVAVVLVSEGLRASFVDVVVLSAFWFVALSSTLDSAWVSPLALGTLTACVLGVVLGLAGVTLLAFWMPGIIEAEPGLLLIMAAGILVASATFETLAARRLPRRRSLIVVGASDGGTELVSELVCRPELPFRCLGVVCDHGEARRLPNALVLGKLKDLTEIVRSHRPDVVVVSRAHERGAAVSKLVDSASIGFRLVGIPEFSEHAFGRVPIEHLSPTWFMSGDLYPHSFSRATKRLLDVTLAVPALLVTALLFPVIALLVHWSGPGPVFFRQRRLGEGGNEFEMLKFRTMRDGAEKPGEPRWAEEFDPRVTRVGRVLRRTRLDELPQLWNVLRGEMSIVGPRPERPEFLALLHEEVPYWTQRLMIKPGITGWAQVRRGYTSDVNGTAEKLAYDLYYLKHRGLVLDLAIILKTGRTVLSGFGAH